MEIHASLLVLGKPCQVHRQYQRPQDPRCRRRHKGYLERFRPHSGRILPPGHVQVWPLRNLQRLLHESRWPRSEREVQGRHLVSWLRKRRIFRRCCALPVGDDQGQDSDKPCWYLPRPLRCRLGRNEPHQSRYPLPLRLSRSSVVSSGAAPSPTLVNDPTNSPYLDPIHDGQVLLLREDCLTLLYPRLH